ncbi:hypothetical protein [Nonomuraea sp. NPDC049709]|uniref:alpha/beta fold hydrolase n=1 Tax=Nonomuraea sp. NPDC049709 TaxID=3154736 RepID=UPI00343EF4BB
MIRQPGAGQAAGADRGLGDLLPKITAPTLVIGNPRDYLVPVERARALPGGEYAELDSGHVVVHERPAELWR